MQKLIILILFLAITSCTTVRTVSSRDRVKTLEKLKQNNSEMEFTLDNGSKIIAQSNSLQATEKELSLNNRNSEYRLPTSELASVKTNSRLKGAGRGLLYGFETSALIACFPLFSIERFGEGMGGGLWAASAVLVVGTTSLISGVSGAFTGYDDIYQFSHDSLSSTLPVENNFEIGLSSIRYNDNYLGYTLSLGSQKNIRNFSCNIDWLKLCNINSHYNDFSVLNFTVNYHFYGYYLGGGISPISRTNFDADDFIGNGIGPKILLTGGYSFAKINLKSELQLPLYKIDQYVRSNVNTEALINTGRIWLPDLRVTAGMNF